MTAGSVAVLITLAVTCAAVAASAAVVEDGADALSGTALSTVQQHANAVTVTGHPVLVLVRTRASSDSGVQDEAAQLMSSRDIESASGARDGVVLLVDLTPGSGIHGHAAIHVGASLASGPLPQDAVTGIYADDLAPGLQRGDIAGGLVAALDAVTKAIKTGVAPVDAFGWVPWVLSLLAIATLIALAVAARAASTLYPPLRLPTRGSEHRPDGDAVLGGALVRGAANRSLNAAVLLELTSTGVVAFRPDGELHLQTLSALPDLPGWASAMHSRLTADMAGDTMSEQATKHFLARRHKHVEHAIDDELVRRGWWVPNSLRAKWFDAALLGAFLIAVASVVAGILRNQPMPEFLWATLVGGGLLLSLKARAGISRLTSQGRKSAAEWARYGRWLMNGLDFSMAPGEVATDAAALGVVPPSALDSVEASLATADPRWRVATSRGTSHRHAIATTVGANYFVGDGMSVIGTGGTDGGAGGGGAGAGGSF